MQFTSTTAILALAAGASAQIQFPSDFPAVTIPTNIPTNFPSSTTSAQATAVPTPATQSANATFPASATTTTTFSSTIAASPSPVPCSVALGGIEQSAQPCLNLMLAGLSGFAELTQETANKILYEVSECNCEKVINRTNPYFSATIGTCADQLDKKKVETYRKYLTYCDAGDYGGFAKASESYVKKNGKKFNYNGPSGTASGSAKNVVSAIIPALAVAFYWMANML